jgi:hypothetical protein
MVSRDCKGMVIFILAWLAAKELILNIDVEGPKPFTHLYLNRPAQGCVHRRETMAASQIKDGSG